MWVATYKACHKAFFQVINWGCRNKTKVVICTNMCVPMNNMRRHCMLKNIAIVQKRG